MWRSLPTVLVLGFLVSGMCMPQATLKTLESNNRRLSQTAGQRLTGELRVLAIHSGDRAQHVYHLLASDNNGYRLHMPPGFQHGTYLTGAKVTVTGAAPAFSVLQGTSPSIQQLNVEDIQLDQDNLAPSEVADAGTAPASMSTLFVILTICNQTNAYFPSDLNTMVFNDLNNPTQETLQGYYSSCSYGKMRLDRSNSRIVNVTLPCSGTANNYWGAWTSYKCDFSDFYGWIDATEQWFTGKYGAAELAKYKYRAYVLPAGSPCNFFALGEVGCGDTCNSWYSQGAGNAISAYAHEMGHNMALHHARKDGSEYSDSSCAMGYCCSVRCYNTPHMWQLGWGSMIGDLNGRVLPAGTVKNFTLPPAHRTSAHMVRVYVDWAGIVPIPSIWLGYRTVGTSGRFLYDSSLDSAFSNVVNVYMYNGTSTDAALRSDHLAALAGATPVWTGLGSSLLPGARELVIRLLQVTTAGAKVTVCRRSAIKETWATCFNGLDDDCDGRIDQADPDCVGVKPDVAPVPAAYSRLLADQNWYRTRHQAPALTWSSTLATAAAAYIQQCPNYADSSDARIKAYTSAYIRNTLQVTDTTIIRDLASVQWYSASAKYSYSNPTLNAVENRFFTQMVWKSTTHIGCAVVNSCSKVMNKQAPLGQRMQAVVCKYWPAGNVASHYTQNVRPPIAGVNFSRLLADQNWYRARHRAPALTWNSALAAAAATYVKTCPNSADPTDAKTNTFSSAFARIAAQGGDTTVITDFASVQWYSGSEQYSYASPSRNAQQSRFFTQMVWKSTTYVGCAAIATCTKSFNQVAPAGQTVQLIVCKYYPAGNKVVAGSYSTYTANVLPPAATTG